MIKFKIIATIAFIAVLMSCDSKNSKTNPESNTINQTEVEGDTLTKHLRAFDSELRTIGLLMYNGVLQSEVIATSDVFSKPTEDGKQLFNVVSIAETDNPIP